MIDYKFNKILNRGGKSIATVTAYEGDFQDVEEKNLETGQMELVNRYVRTKKLWTKEVESFSKDMEDLRTIANKEIELDTREAIPVQINDATKIERLKRLDYVKVEDGVRTTVIAEEIAPAEVVDLPPLEIAPDITNPINLDNATSTRTM